MYTLFSFFRYSTRLVSTPFERIGYETGWKKVDDAMSITTYTANKIKIYEDYPDTNTAASI